MGNQQPKLLAGLPVVIIVGGGYAGVTVAKALDATGKCNVIVIERKEYFLHNIGSLRAAVQLGFEKQIMFPYTHLLKHGSVIHAQVTRIDSNVIHLYGYQQVIKFDYLVVATGSTYAFPGKVEDFSYQGAQEKFTILQSQIRQAQKIAIIGGGPVGIELAGEIASELPDKKITLLHKYDKLMDDAMKHELRDELQSQLERFHVKLVLGQKVDLGQLEQKISHHHGMGTSYITGQHTLVTDQGTSIDADLIFVATGTRTNTHTWKNTLPLAKDGRIKVNSFLQVEGHPHIYAIGDCASIGRKMAWFAGMHAETAAKNILAVIAGKQPKPYAGDPSAAAVVPVGKNGGASQLPMHGGMIVKQRITRILKSGNLMVDKYRGFLNAPSTFPNPSSRSTSDTHLRNVSVVFGHDHDIQPSQLLMKGLPVDNTLEMMIEQGQNRVQ